MNNYIDVDYNLYYIAIILKNVILLFNYLHSIINALE